MRVTITDLVARIATGDRSAFLAKLRMWIMFDRDADDGDANLPSAESERLLTLCQSNGFQCFRLARRSIENYLPNASLNAWAGDVTSRKDLVSALLDQRFGPARRQRLHMKEGLVRDLHRHLRGQLLKNGQLVRPLTSADLLPPFSDLAPDLVGPLSQGFGRHIAGEFGSAAVADAEYHSVFQDCGENGRIAASLCARF
jgi:hypothetical protein